MVFTVGSPLTPEFYLEDFNIHIFGQSLSDINGFTYQPKYVLLDFIFAI